MALTLLLASVPVTAAHHEAGEASAEASAAAEENGRKPWDQDAMTDLSGRLAQQMAQVRRSFRKDPNFREARAPNVRAIHQMEQTLRDLELTSRTLHRRVQNGKGFEETEMTARRIAMLLNDADMWSRRIQSNAFLEAQVKPAMALINEIAPYYGSGPLFDPETMQRLDRAPNPDLPAPSPAPEG